MEPQNGRNQAADFALLPPGLATGASPGTEDFSAAVVGLGPFHDIGLWSDQATSGWAAATTPPDPYILAPPSGFTAAQTPGGLELWQLGPKVLTWASPDPAPLYTQQPNGALAPDGSYNVYVLTALPTPPPGGTPLSTDLSSVVDKVTITPSGRAGVTLTKPTDVGVQGSSDDPVLKVNLPGYYGQLSGGAPFTWSDAGTYYGQVQQEPVTQRYMAGTPPGAVTGYELWGASFPVPPPNGDAYPVSVTVHAVNGATETLQILVQPTCGGTHVWNGSQCALPRPHQVIPSCPSGQWWNGTACAALPPGAGSRPYVTLIPDYCATMNPWAPNAYGCADPGTGPPPDLGTPTVCRNEVCVYGNLPPGAPGP